MVEKTTKTLEQITQDVLNSHFGITDEDLTALFADTTTDKGVSPNTSPVTPSTETATEPAKPVAVAPVETPKPAETPAPAVPPTQLPEPGRAGSVSPETEKNLKSQAEQIAKLQLALQELQKRPQVQHVATPQTTQPVQQTSPLDEIDDQAIIEKPKESIVKLMNAMLRVALPAAFVEYDTAVSKRAAMENFRREHSDFDELRPIMRQIVLENPAQNDNPDALPRIYEEAKQRRLTYLESLKKELGVQPAAPQSSTSAPQPQLSEEELLTKLEQRIAEKIRKRRAGAGTASPTSQPVLPTERMAVPSSGPEPTEADKMMEAMLKAGTAAESFLKGIDTVKK